MRSLPELVTRLGALLLAKSAVSFYLNGGPGSGKSYLLKRLADQLPSAIPGAFVVGPARVGPTTLDELVATQMRACLDAGFVEGLPDEYDTWDIATAWTWLGNQPYIPRHQVFIVLVDLDPDLDLSLVAQLFSSARHLERAWRTANARILYLFVGSWNTQALKEHYARSGVSFPYTEGHNFAIWEGLDTDAMVDLVHRHASGALDIHGRVLFELSGGNPAVAVEVLQAADEANDAAPSLQRLLEATKDVATEGSMARRMLSLWPELLPKGQQIVKQLLHRRYVTDPGSQAHVNQLLTLGLVRREKSEGQSYLGFKSWFVELLLRLHLTELGLEGERLNRVAVEEMVAPVTSVNDEAYHIIHEVENKVRNFVTLQFSMQEGPGAHILQGRAARYLEEVNATEDAYDRALHWRQRSQRAGLSADLNPLLTYCSTRLLADLVEEMGRQTSSEVWLTIAQALRELADVRDAVMHNQLIDDAQLRRLHALRAAVYAGLAHA